MLYFVLLREKTEIFVGPTTNTNICQYISSWFFCSIRIELRIMRIIHHVLQTQLGITFTT